MNAFCLIVRNLYDITIQIYWYAISYKYLNSLWIIRSRHYVVLCAEMVADACRIGMATSRVVRHVPSLEALTLDDKSVWVWALLDFHWKLNLLFNCFWVACWLSWATYRPSCCHSTVQPLNSHHLRHSLVCILHIRDCLLAWLLLLHIDKLSCQLELHLVLAECLRELRLIRVVISRGHMGVSKWIRFKSITVLRHGSFCSMLVSQSDTFILTCHIRVVQSLELWLCIATSHLSGTTSFLAGGAFATYQILFQFIVFLGDQLCKVIFSLFSYLANAEILLAGRPHIRQSVIHYHLPLLCICLTNFGLQVQKVVLLCLDKCRCLLRLLLKLLLSVNQVSL